MRVNQVLSAAGAVDAVTNQALVWRDQFHAWGWEGEVFSARPPVGLKRNQIRPLEDLDTAEGVVLLHYSGYGRQLERAFGNQARTMLLSHNVTPSEWFWSHAPLEGVNCKLGRNQLHELAGRADRLAAVSDFNAEELRDATNREVDVIPVLFDPSQLGPGWQESDPPIRRDPPTVLFVGRLAPHKRQNLVIRAFAEYRRREPAARLVLVGSPLSPGYLRWLTLLAKDLAPGAVTFESGISPGALADRYRQAAVFLCLSEHEGFCIPLLEAFHFGVPVVARNAGAVGEVLGDAGVLLDLDENLGTVAHLLGIVAQDAELRSELRARGQRRLERYTPQATIELMRRSLTELAEGAAPVRGAA